MEEKKDSFDFRFLNKLMYISTFIIVFYLLKSIGILDKITIVIKALIPVLLGIVICYFAMPLVNRLKKLGLSKNISAILSLIIMFTFYFINGFFRKDPSLCTMIPLFFYSLNFNIV